jgi:hypothetical protein
MSRERVGVAQFGQRPASGSAPGAQLSFNMNAKAVVMTHSR